MTTTNLLQTPDTVALLLGALREYFKHMPEHERAGSYDLFEMLRQLGNNEELAHRAYEAIDCRLMKVHVDRTEADLQEFQNRASYAAMLRVITGAHVEAQLDCPTEEEGAAEEALAAAQTAPTNNPTARELRGLLFQVQDQDVPLTDAELAALTGRR